MTDREEVRRAMHNRALALNAERDRLISQGVDPAALLVAGDTMTEKLPDLGEGRIMARLVLMTADEQRNRLAKALEVACRGGYVPELPLDMIADRLLAAGVRVGPDEGLREAREAVAVLLDRIDYVNGSDAAAVVQRVKAALGIGSAE